MTDTPIASIVSAAHTVLREFDTMIEDPQFQSVFVMAGIHGVKYDGSRYAALEVAIKNLRAALMVKQPEPTTI